MGTPARDPDPFGLLRPTIAVAYPQLLVEIVTERGYTLAQLLADTPLSEARLTHPESRISPYEWGLMITRASALTQDPGLGYAFGLRMRPSAHGFLGYATLSSASVQEALEIATRFFELRQRNFTMRLLRQPDHCAVEVREKHPIPMLRRFFYENILIGLAKGAAAILGLELNQFREAEIGFDWPEPPYHAAYRDQLPTVRFSRPANQVRIPAALLERRPVLADPHASRQALALCERELAQIGGGEDPIDLRVCSELVLGPDGGYPDLETLARRLRTSSRSLARKLRLGGTSYRTLLDEARRRDACALIENSALELQAIADRLGYVNPANFTRAFRKWTGESPSAFRARLRGSAYPLPPA
jgi:AraC-like DNA-binding protein